ncbi:MAG: hypothetical protein ACI9DJ_003291 [Algoriphagus sp.]|jgi:hypothetical protein
MMRISSLLIILFTISSCTKEPTPGASVTKPGSSEQSLWSIPLSEVKDGGVGQDGIRSIDDPTIVEGVNASTFLNDDELILGLKYGQLAIAYPHKILDYHEIINHQIDDFAFSVSFCPLTGTGILYNRKIENTETTFGVSGLLFNSNLIMYDRASGSLWPQMMLKSVNGEHKDKEAEFGQLIETSWATWKKWFPNTKVMAPNPDGGPNYNRYPYGDYRTNDDFLLFSVPTKLKGFPQKERILGIENNGEVLSSRFSTFSEDLSGFLVREIGGEKMFIFGSEKENYMFAYFAKTEMGDVIELAELLLGLEEGGLFLDTEGNKWDIMGRAYKGDRTGQQLKVPVNYIGYAFAWAAFYPDNFVVE